MLSVNRMPEFLEKILETAAKRKGLTGREAKRYEYGAMNNMGAMHGNKITTKGVAMERKHIDNGHRNVKGKGHGEKLRHI
jgi:hypothetical protein